MGGVGGGKCIQRFLENQIHLHRKWDWPSLFWYIFIDLCTVQYFLGSSLHATIRDWAADQDSLKTLQRAVSLFNSLHDIWKILRSDITRVAPNSMFIYQMSESFEGEKLMTNRHLWDLRCLLLLINCLHVSWHLVIFYLQYIPFALLSAEVNVVHGCCCWISNYTCYALTRAHWPENLERWPTIWSRTNSAIL